MAPYDAICFDLDYTLCVPTQDADTLLEQTFRRAGLEPFCSVTDIREAVPSLPTAETDREFYRSLFAHVAEAAGVDPACSARLTDSYLELRDPSAVAFRPGAETALEHARERGQVGLITNGGRETQMKKLETLEIADAFDVRVFVDPSAGILPKPNAAPFAYALSELGASPEATIHVGDSIHADVAGANAFGLDSALVDDRGRDRYADPEHEPTYELASLAGLTSII